MASVLLYSGHDPVEGNCSRYSTSHQFIILHVEDLYYSILTIILLKH